MGRQTCPEYFESFVSSPETWLASSLVGTSTIAEGTFLPASIVPRMIDPYAPVFPVPVWAWPNMSIPLSPRGMELTWIGVGSSHPMSSIAFATSSGMPISVNLEIIQTTDLKLCLGQDPDDFPFSSMRTWNSFINIIKRG